MHFSPWRKEFQVCRQQAPLESESLEIHQSTIADEMFIRGG